MEFTGLAAQLLSNSLFQADNSFSEPGLPFILIDFVMVIGVAVTAKAGLNRDSLLIKNGNSSNITKGIIIAISCGLLSALLNVGFANASPVAKMAESYGVITRNSSLAAWVVVLFGGYVMNAGYAIFLLTKNKSLNSFLLPSSGRIFLVYYFRNKLVCFRHLWARISHDW